MGLQIDSFSTSITRMVGVAGGGMLLVILFGCMSFSIERPAHVHYSGPIQGAEPLEQQGKVTVERGESLLVYYPVPYISNPNLTIQEVDSSGFHRSFLVDQQPTHFRVKNPGLFAREITWVSRGVSILSKPTAPPPALMPANPSAPMVPPPTSQPPLPATPIPITTPQPASGPALPSPTKEVGRAPGRSG